MKKWLRKLWKFLWKAALWFLAISFCWVLLYKWVDPPITFLMISKWFECDKKECKINKTWKNYEKINENMALAVVVCEDQNFFKHNGFDYGAIQKALKQNKTRKRKRGASTISQQVAKKCISMAISQLGAKRV